MTPIRDVNLIGCGDNDTFRLFLMRESGEAWEPPTFISTAIDLASGEGSTMARSSASGSALMC